MKKLDSNVNLAFFYRKVLYIEETRILSFLRFD